MIEAIKELKENDIVAFKTKDTKEWYCGTIQSIIKVSSCRMPFINISVHIPIAPQWYEKEDKTQYDLNDITELKILYTI
jgi:hypothetical protein